MLIFFIGSGTITFCYLAYLGYKTFATWQLCHHPELTDAQTESIANMASRTKPPHNARI